MSRENTARMFAMQYKLGTPINPWKTPLAPDHSRLRDSKWTDYSTPITANEESKLRVVNWTPHYAPDSLFSTSTNPLAFLGNITSYRTDMDMSESEPDPDCPSRRKVPGKTRKRFSPYQRQQVRIRNDSPQAGQSLESQQSSTNVAPLWELFAPAAAARGKSSVNEQERCTSTYHREETRSERRSRFLKESVDGFADDERYLDYSETQQVFYQHFLLKWETEHEDLPGARDNIWAAFVKHYATIKKALAIATDPASVKARLHAMERVSRYKGEVWMETDAESSEQDDKDVLSELADDDVF